MFDFLKRRIDRQAKTAATQRAAAEKEYRRILAAAVKTGDVSARDDEPLESAIVTLGITPEAFAATLAALLQHQELKGKIGQKPADPTALRSKLQSHLAESERIAQEREAAADAIRDQISTADAAVTAHRQAVEEVEKLERQHWHALGLPDPRPGEAAAAQEAARERNRRHFAQSPADFKAKASYPVLTMADVVRYATTPGMPALMPPGIEFVPLPTQSQRDVDEIVSLARTASQNSRLLIPASGAPIPLEFPVHEHAIKEQAIMQQAAEGADIKRRSLVPTPGLSLSDFRKILATADQALQQYQARFRGFEAARAATTPAPGLLSA